MRFGIALALIISVLVSLYVGPALRQAADQLRNYRSNALHTAGPAVRVESKDVHAEGQ